MVLTLNCVVLAEPSPDSTMFSGRNGSEHVLRVVQVGDKEEKEERQEDKRSNLRFLVFPLVLEKSVEQKGAFEVLDIVTKDSEQLSFVLDRHD